MKYKEIIDETQEEVDRKIHVKYIDKSIQMINTLIGRLSDVRNYNNIGYLKNKKKELEKMRESLFKKIGGVEE